jgi:hypothetical protein
MTNYHELGYLPILHLVLAFYTRTMYIFSPSYVRHAHTKKTTFYSALTRARNRDSGPYSDWPRTGRPRVRSSSLGRSEICSPRRPDPASYPIGAGALPPGGGGVKRPDHEADHSPPNRAEVRNVDL